MPNVSPRIRLVYNDDELRKAYLLLADRVAKKYLKKALKDATLITHANAHHRVPFKTGALLKSLATRSTRTRKGALAAAMSGNGAFQPPRAIRNPIRGTPAMNASDQAISVTARASPRRS